MPLTIEMFPGLLPFTADPCAVVGGIRRPAGGAGSNTAVWTNVFTEVPGGRFAGAKVFGASALAITNTGAAPATIVSVKVSPGSFKLYGPTSHVTIPPNGRIPLGIAFARASTDSGPVVATVTVTARESPSPRVPLTTATFPVTCTVRPSSQGYAATFVPSEVELTGCAMQKTVTLGLLCQRDLPFGAFGGTAFASTSAFRLDLPGPRIRLDQGTAARATFSFDPDPAKLRTPQLVRVTANSQEVPFIGWVADTVLPGEVEIDLSRASVDPVAADVANESVAIRNVSNRRLDLGGCTLGDEAGSNPGFPFPPTFLLSPGESVTVHTGNGQKSGSDLFWNQPRPVWNNDFDTALVKNLAGDEVARRFYMFEIPGVRTTNQMKVFDVVMSISRAMPLDVTVVEDGDFVVFEPVPTSTVWTGSLLTGNSGPGGLGMPAPYDWRVAGASMFALFANAGGAPLLIGAGPVVANLVNRASPLKSGTMLTLFVNDNGEQVVDTFGSYFCRVRVFRR